MLSHLGYISFSNAKKRPPFEIRRVVNLLLIAAKALMTSGEYVITLNNASDYRANGPYWVD